MEKLTLNSIFREYADEYLIRYPKLKLQEKKVFRSIQICRTEALGGRIEQCNHCGSEIILYNSCRNRHCPQCQNMKKEQWIHDRKEETLPFTYFHIVFPLPEELKGIVWRNKRKLFDLMFRMAKETLLSVSAEEKYFGADIGFFAILHTWGQLLNQHPHLHCVVPGGGFSQKKQKWIHAPYDYLAPVQVFKARFRSLFLVALKKLYANGELYLKGTRYQDPVIFQQLINSLFSKEWVVYLKESFQNRNSVIEYLARYTHRIAISNHRIISLENNIVTFKYRDYKDSNKEKTAQMEVLTFMHRFMAHVLPYRFVRIRYFGILSHRNKKKAIQACRDFYGIDSKNFSSDKFDWRKLFIKKTGIDPTVCSVCGKGRLVAIEIIPEIRYRPPPVEKLAEYDKVSFL